MTETKTDSATLLAKEPVSGQSNKKNKGNNKKAPEITIDAPQASKSPDLAKNEAEKAIENETKNKDTKTTQQNKQPKESQVEAPKAEKNMANTESKKSSGGKGLSLLAIAMVIALGGGLYYHGHQQSLALKAQIDTLSAQINTLKTQSQGAITNIANHETLFAQSKKERQDQQVLIQQQDNNLTSLQNALIELKGRRPNDWLLAEADHLVKRAAKQLYLEKDLTSTIRLLETADQRISQLNDPSLAPIRQTLAMDIQSIKSIEKIDFEGIVVQLNALENQVDTLPLANAMLTEEIKQQTPEEVTGELDHWKENLITSVKKFGDHFITYRKREGNVVPMLTPAQTFYLRENLKAKLAQATNAVYRENKEIYLNSLDTAEKWVNQFYNLEMPETKTFIEAINQLKTKHIKVNLPSQLASLQQVGDKLNETLRQALAVPVTPNTPIAAQGDSQ